MKSFELPVLHCNTDWAGDVNTWRSTTGYVSTLAGGTLTWKSMLQLTVALSSAEAEYRAITEAGQELVCLRNMMARFGMQDQNPTVLSSDNMGVIHLTSKFIFHGRTKHVKIQHHSIQEIVNQGTLALKHCPTIDMVADLLTKPLEKSQFQRLRLKLGVTCVP